MRSFKHIAKLIRTKRLNHPNGLSQSDVSKLLGYKNGQFISNVERGLCNIPLKMLPKICEILTIPKEELKKAIMNDHEETINNFLQMGEGTQAQRSEQPAMERPAPLRTSFPA